MSFDGVGTLPGGEPTARAAGLLMRLRELGLKLALMGDEIMVCPAERVGAGVMVALREHRDSVSWLLAQGERPILLQPEQRDVMLLPRGVTCAAGDAFAPATDIIQGDRMPRQMREAHAGDSFVFVAREAQPEAGGRVVVSAAWRFVQA